MNVKEFYPTPENLLHKMTAGIDWRKVKYVLEPSAGKGNIVDHIVNEAHIHYNDKLDIDCIEADSELRAVLSNKELPVVGDDFLSFETFKSYDLIIMNPPFSNGDEHLLKALDLQKNGGAVVCLLNAQTLKNPNTNRRKDLVTRLSDLGAEVTYIENAFLNAERKTSVAVALVRVFIEKPVRESRIFESLKKKYYAENSGDDPRTDLAPNDYVEAIVRNYEMEVEAGLALMREYEALRRTLLKSLKSDGTSSDGCILKLKLANSDDISPNEYIERVRRKYWEALFMDRRFTENMTSNLLDEYRGKVNNLIHFDFSTYNIRAIQIEMSKNLVRGVEDCIIALFDKLSYQYSYSNELSKNIHYYNGWCTNKSWYINKKVIIPRVNAWGSHFKDRYDPLNYSVICKLKDIEKALDYLDGGKAEDVDIYQSFRDAKEAGVTKKIPLKHFDVTFYKKGTCHIEFRDMDLLKKLNIFGSQQKGWLPPAYGKKKYSDMDASEKAVVDEFEGKREYEKTLSNSEYFIYNPQRDIKRIGDIAA